MLRNVFLVVALVAGAIIGYFVGSFSGGEAKQALKMEQKLSAEAKLQNQLAQKSLQEKMAALVTDHTGKLDALSREKTEALAQFETEKKARTAAIQQANTAKATLDKRLGELDKARRAADPGSADRKNIEAEMGRLASENAALQKRVTGLECGRVPLPKETLDKFSLKVS